MKIEYDVDADVLTIRLKKGKYDESETAGPYVIIDLDEDQTPLAIEILDAKRTLGIDVTTLTAELSLRIPAVQDAKGE